jgi:hypothetical protein
MPWQPARQPTNHLWDLQGTSLHGGANGLWAADFQVVDDTSIPSVAGVLATFSCQMAVQCYKALLASYDAATDEGKQATAWLCCCAFRASAAWLTVLPMTSTLLLRHREFRVPLQHLLGMSPMPAYVVGLQCQYTSKAIIAAADHNHFMGCAQAQGRAMLRHNILTWVACRVVHQAELASTLEPPIRRRPVLASAAISSSHICSSRIAYFFICPFLVCVKYILISRLLG